MPVTCRDCFLVPKTPQAQPPNCLAYLINSKDPMGIVMFCLFAPFESGFPPLSVVYLSFFFLELGFQSLCVQSSWGIGSPLSP